MKMIPKTIKIFNDYFYYMLHYRKPVHTIHGHDRFNFLIFHDDGEKYFFNILYRYLSKSLSASTMSNFLILFLKR